MTTATTVIEMPVTRPTQQTALDDSNGPVPAADRSGPTQITLDPFGQVDGQAVEAWERWNRPRINSYRLAAIFFAFLVFGMNDGSYGALVPYVRPKTFFSRRPMPRSSDGSRSNKTTICPTLSPPWSSCRPSPAIR